MYCNLIDVTPGTIINYVPGGAPDGPDNLGGEAAIPGDVHSTQEGPSGNVSEVGGGTNVSRQDTLPGGPGSEQEARGDPDEPVDETDVPGVTQSDQEGPRGDMNTQC
jgi:hypothetical protein